MSNVSPASASKHHISAQLTLELDCDNESTLSTVESTVGSVGDCSPPPEEESDDDGFNYFNFSETDRMQLRKEAYQRRQRLMRARDTESRTNSKLTGLRAVEHQLVGALTWNKEKIGIIRDKISVYEGKLEKARQEVKEAQADIDQHKTIVQTRNPGLCRREEADSLAAPFDKEYLAALAACLNSCPVLSLDDCLQAVRPYLQNFMTQSNLAMATELGDKGQEIFKHTLHDYVKYVEGKGDKVFIRTYTGQRVPVYSAVSAQMVNTETRFADSKLSKAVRECMQWQAMLHRELSLLPPLGVKRLYRGIAHKFDDLMEAYPHGATKILYEPKSTSMEEAEAAEFATPEGTMFVMDTFTAVDITSYSFYPSEKEALIKMLTRFRVTNAFRKPGSYDEIWMEEILEEGEDAVSACF